MVMVATGGAVVAGVGAGALVVVVSPPHPDKVKPTNAVTTVAKTAFIAKSCLLQKEKF
jgi:hypothetical protein